ncbi:hypothetical protein [Dactylosporangium sp. NPDC000521]|uniref:hypothetical protein n=1 Tax=Dactylosporangium sp. NPDC000521 TaxID=3363975 RepID=UPI00367DD5AC
MRTRLLFVRHGESVLKTDAVVGGPNGCRGLTETGHAVLDIAHRHRGGTAILVGHAETVESSFHALAAQPLDRAFDLAVAPASVTEWTTAADPTAWPPPRWTLRRCNDVR